MRSNEHHSDLSTIPNITSSSGTSSSRSTSSYSKIEVVVMEILLFWPLQGVGSHHRRVGWTTRGHPLHVKVD